MISGLALGTPVFAQTTTSPPATSLATQPTWYSHQADEMPSKLIGTNIVNAANETVGGVNELVVGKNGRVAAAIMGVGGFLGWVSTNWRWASIPFA